MGAVWKQEIRSIFGKRRLILAVVCFALLFLFAFFERRNTESGNDNSTDRISVGVINEDDSLLANMLIDYVLTGGVFSGHLQIEIDTAENIIAGFTAGIYDAYLHVPKGFTEKMVYLEHLPVEVVISADNTSKALLIQNLLLSYEEYVAIVERSCVSLYDICLASGLSVKEANKANEGLSVNLVKLVLAKNSFYETEEVKGYVTTRLIPYYLHEVLFLLLGFLALLYGFHYKKMHAAGICRRMMSMGYSLVFFPLEKILFWGVVLAGFLGISAVLLLLSNIAVPLTVLLFIWLFGILFCSVMLLFAVLFEKNTTYLMASCLLLLFGALCGGGVIPVMYMPDRILSIAKCFPNYWYINEIFRLEQGAPKEEFPQVCIALAATALILFLLGVFVLHRKEGRVSENE